MAAFSKYFYIQNQGKVCADYTHQGVSCARFAWNTFFDSFVGGLQYYFPSIVLPMLLKKKNWSRALWLNVVRDYLRATFFGSCCLICIGFGSFCIFYEFLRKHHNLFIALPCFLGATFCVFLPKGLREIQSIGGVNMFLEYIIRSSDNKIMIKLKKSENIGAFIFMILSALIIYSFRTNGIRRFWFITTSSEIENDKDNENQVNQKNSPWMNLLIKSNRKVCSHSASCDKFIGTQITNAASFGLAFGICKVILSKSKELQNNLTKVPRLVIQYFDYNIFLFLVTYNGIFKTIHCLSNRYHKKDLLSNAIISGFISGISFKFYPKFLIISFAFVRVVQLFWMSYMSSYKGEIINKIPFSTLIYVLSASFLFQTRVYYPNLTPEYVHKIMSLGTANRIDNLSANYAAILMGLNHNSPS